MSASTTKAEQLISIVLKKGNGQLLSAEEEKILHDFTSVKDPTGRTGADWIREMLAYEESANPRRNEVVEKLAAAVKKYQ